jgi:hypothetical protein
MCNLVSGCSSIDRLSNDAAIVRNLPTFSSSNHGRYVLLGRIYNLQASHIETVTRTTCSVQAGMSYR